tara:strand:- start:106 stop:486 length:381 start_codon:yes stop_codon:yes gene_type:complete
MSVEISISQELINKNIPVLDNGCNEILNAFQKSNLEGKFVPNYSIINNKLELGCTITMDKEYKNKKNLANVWKIIQETSDSSEIIQKYICAHIKIDNVYNGCIFDYLDNQKCPHKVNNIYRLITLF